MMYLDKQKTQALKNEAGGWIGTPFRGHAMVKGFGVDCVHLVLALYQHIGLLKGVEKQLPPYGISEGGNLHVSKVIDWIERHGGFEQIEKSSDLIAGDMLGFRIGRVVHHVGVVLDYPKFIHVYKGANVIVSTLLDATWFSRLKNIWRPVI
jgi:cell wall-associated NlpC family hydrolase